MNTERIIKSYLDGIFVKFAGSYCDGKWPFKAVPVEPDFIPDYCQKSYTERAQEDGRRGHDECRIPRRGGGPPLRVATPDEIALIRQHAKEKIAQEYTRALLGMGSETWARARLAAGFTVNKRSK